MTIRRENTVYRVSMAQWFERWHGITEALGLSPGLDLIFHHLLQLYISKIEKGTVFLHLRVLVFIDLVQFSQF